MRRAHLALLVALLLIGGAFLGSVQAEDDGQPRRLATQIFNVGALMRGATDFIPNLLGTVTPDMVSDEENPLFGAEGEEPVLAFGTLDELIELLKTTVKPVFWEVTEGADLRGLGNDGLLARATPEVLAELAVRLAWFESQALSTVEVDVVTIAGDAAGSASGATALSSERARALLRKAAGPRLLMSGRLNQRIHAWTGAQRTYVQDYDVEVATSSSVADPIVGVVSLGLTGDARATLVGDGPHVQLLVNAVLAEEIGTRVHDMGGDHRIELPQIRATRIRFDQVVTPGAWYLAPGAGGAASADQLVLLRARVRRPAMAPAALAPLPPWPQADMAPLEIRILPVADLNVSPYDEIGDELNLVPSNFTPPEPPELAEPSPIFPADGLVELLQMIAPTRAWNRTGTSIDTRNGYLFVSQTPSLLDAMETTLDALRSRFLWTITLDVELLDLPAGLGERLLDSRFEGAGYVGDRARKAIDAAVESGEAQRVVHAKVTSLAGSRSAVFSGRQHHFVQDYEVEIAEATNIANPVVVKLTEGLVADLHPALTSAENAVTVGLRLSVASLRGPIQQTPSPHGPIDVPLLDVLKIRGDVHIPLGQTALIGAGGDGKRIRLLLIQPTLERARR